MHIGVNLNNREALIAPDYDLAALSQRTTRVRLGTACLVTTLRHPVQLAHAWATLDVLSGGRTVLGACAGNLAEDGVKEEFAVRGVDRRHRMAVFSEGMRIVRSLLSTGRVSYAGEHFALDEVAFYTGAEPAPLLPMQTPPPIWIVANPSIGADAAQRSSRAARRVAELGDGWMTCCRASHPEEVEGFLSELAGLRSLDGFDVAYQGTMTLGHTRDAALAEQRRYIDAHYPEFRDAVTLADWGPAGTPDEAAEWIRRFRRAGVSTFICRFASLDQPGQLELFAAEVLPVVRPDAGQAALGGASAERTS